MYHFLTEASYPAPNCTIVRKSLVKAKTGRKRLSLDSDKSVAVNVRGSIVVYLLEPLEGYL